MKKLSLSRFLKVRLIMPSFWSSHTDFVTYFPQFSWLSIYTHNRIQHKTLEFHMIGVWSRVFLGLLCQMLFENPGIRHRQKFCHLRPVIAHFYHLGHTRVSPTKNMLMFRNNVITVIMWSSVLFLKRVSIILQASDHVDVKLIGRIRFTSLFMYCG